MNHTRKLAGISASLIGLVFVIWLHTLLRPSQTAALAPMITVDPTSLSSNQPPQTAVSQTLTIANNGDSDLVWYVFDGLTNLWEQRDSVSPNNGVPSQYFPDFDEAGYAADDFVVPNGETWQIGRISLLGTYADGDEKAGTFDVNVYADASGMPGALVLSRTAVIPSSDISGAITIDLLTPFNLSTGTYWLSANANMLFGASQSQWFWRTRTVQNDAPYHWRESVGIFGTSCVGAWRPGTACGVGGGSNPDLAFALQEPLFDTDCDRLSDLPWLQITPGSGTISASQSQAITVNFNSENLLPGVYTGTLCLGSNDSAQPLLPVPLTLTITALPLAVSLGPDAGRSGQPGDNVPYAVTVTNVGTTADSYNLTISSTWPATVSPSSLSLSSGESMAVSVMVTIPATAAIGEMDTAVITAVSAADASVQDTVTLVTTAVLSNQHFTYLPLHTKDQ